MAITSSIDVANLSLDEIGEPPVANITTPTTREEEIVARQYNRARRALLREFVWNFAKKYANISREAEDPLFKYADSYQLPNDFVRLLVIGGETESTQLKDYDISGRSVYCNASGASSIQLMYIFDVKDMKLWDDLAKDVLVSKLALNLGYAFSKDEDMLKRLERSLFAAMPAAVSVDGQERPPRRIQRSVYRDARGYYSSGSSPGYYVDFDNA